MIERWEYLTLWYRYMTNAVRKGSDEPYEFTMSYVVRRPDGTVEEHPGSTSVDGLLNELGAKGWELVAETVWDSVIVGVNGWPEAGTPASAKWTFKRRSTDKPEPDKPEPSDLQRYMEERKR